MLAVCHYKLYFVHKSAEYNDIIFYTLIENVAGHIRMAFPITIEFRTQDTRLAKSKMQLWIMANFSVFFKINRRK